MFNYLRIGMGTVLMAAADKGGAVGGAAASKEAHKGETPPEDEAGPELAKKISIKTVVGSIVGDRRPSYDIEKDKGEEKALMRVYGMARGIRQGSSTYGPWLSFKGDFEAINLLTGETKRGVEVFLPEPVQTEMWGRLNETQKDDPGASIQFAFDIYARGTKTVVGYEYFVKAVIKASGADPLAALRNSVKALPLPALAAPKKSAA